MVVFALTLSPTCRSEGNPDGSDLKTSGRFFSETNFLIFQIDVRQVVPVDKDIAELLGENLKQNTSILCQKVGIVAPSS